MIWADRKGNIGWQATGITPRRSWTGLLPVPGDGRFEWSGYLPTVQLPWLTNPPEGFLATANEENLPPAYPNVVGYLWTEPFRYSRIREVLSSGRLSGVPDLVALQLDEYSAVARTLVSFLPHRWPTPLGRRALRLLQDWDFVMAKDSAAAAIYQVWENNLQEKVWRQIVGIETEDLFPRRSLRRLIAWLTAPHSRFGANPLAGRDLLVRESFRKTLEELRESQGDDIERWQYGDARLHHVLLRHPLSEVVTDTLRTKLDMVPLPRGGNGFTVNMTNSKNQQTSGASFRVVIDLADWDSSVATNSPGQSGDPASPHYRDLYQMWADGEYFPLLFSREKIEAAATELLLLEPETGSP
jgi:penicillin amidase